MSYTNGPWRLAKTGEVMNGYSQPFAIVEDGQPNLIAGCFGDVKGGDEVAESNARLIAAAPDLMECCIQALAIEESVTIKQQHELAQGFVAKLRNALKKAEGK